MFSHSILRILATKKVKSVTGTQEKASLRKSGGQAEGTSSLKAT